MFVSAVFNNYFLTVSAAGVELIENSSNRFIKKAGALGTAASSRARILRDAVSQKIKKIHANTAEEIKAFALHQWEAGYDDRFLYSYKNMTTNERPQFIVFFAHGYRPYLPTKRYASDRFSRHVAPFLEAFKYVAVHPLLKVGPLYTSFAQESDINQIKLHLDKVLERVANPQSTFFGLPVIIAGHSNGAATIISLLGSYPELSKKIFGALLYAPYADIRKTNMIHKVSLQGGSSALVDRVPLVIGTRYDGSKRAPIDYLKEGLFPRMPVFLIHAKNDPVISFDQNYVAFESLFKEHEFGSLFHAHPFDLGAHGSFSVKSKKEDREKLRQDVTHFVSEHLLKPRSAQLGLFGSLSSAVIDY